MPSARISFFFYIKTALSLSQTTNRRLRWTGVFINVTSILEFVVPTRIHSVAIFFWPSISFPAHLHSSCTIVELTCTEIFDSWQIKLCKNVQRWFPNTFRISFRATIPENVRNFIKLNREHFPYDYSHSPYRKNRPGMRRRYKFPSPKIIRE